MFPKVFFSPNSTALSTALQHFKLKCSKHFNARTVLYTSQGLFWSIQQAMYLFYLVHAMAHQSAKATCPAWVDCSVADTNTPFTAAVVAYLHRKLQKNIKKHVLLPPHALHFVTTKIRKSKVQEW